MTVLLNYHRPRECFSNLLLQMIRRNTERGKLSVSEGFTTWHIWTKGNCFRKSQLIISELHQYMKPGRGSWSHLNLSESSALLHPQQNQGLPVKDAELNICVGSCLLNSTILLLSLYKQWALKLPEAKKPGEEIFNLSGRMKLYAADKVGAVWKYQM